MCRSIHAHACNGISHVKLVHSCQSLRRGERLSFQGFHSQDPKDPSHYSPVPAYHELTPSTYSICILQSASTRSLLWLLARSWGKASDAYMPFVPVSMGSYYFCYLLPDFVFGSSFPPPTFLSPSSLYKVSFTRGWLAPIARAQNIPKLYHTLPLPPRNLNSPHQ